MKLYLSSYRIPNPKKLFKLLDKDPEKVKVALIPNAKDYYSELARNFKINEVKTYLESIDLSSDIVDLRLYSSAKKLKKELQKYDLIWVTGGNTFCLRYQMKRSGFDKIIKELIDDGLVYAGDSAGAIITGPTLRGVENADIPEFAEEYIWNGLCITDKIILPHADNPLFQDSLVKFRELHSKNKNYVELNDDQDYIIEI